MPTNVRLQIVVAFATATLALLFTFHLITTFGFPELNSLLLRPNDESRTSPLPQQAPEEDYGSEQHRTQYLLGVGKADITGYGRVAPNSVILVDSDL